MSVNIKSPQPLATTVDLKFVSPSYQLVETYLFITGSPVTTMLTQNIASRYCLFAEPRQNRQVIINRESMTLAPGEGNICIPLVIDTEYVSQTLPWNIAPQQSRKGLTTQIKGIHSDAPGFIYAHRNFARKIPRHPEITFGFHPVQYLQSLGFDVSLRRETHIDKDMPVAEFVLYAHFALAEALMIVEGEYRDDFIRFMDEKAEKLPQFEMNRRMFLKTPKPFGGDDSAKLPWILTLDGREFAVSVSFIDTCAIHGQASYADFCAASGVELPYKHLFDKPSEKSRMDVMAVERPEEFDNYALGDLQVYEALVNNAENSKVVYSALGIAERYTEPQLTIGSTTQRMFKSVLAAALGVDDAMFNKDTVPKYIAAASAGELRKNSNNTSALLAKVQGGRCRFNRPSDIIKNTPIVDLDISGCYGEGMRNQSYFIGVPEIVSYPVSSTRNEYMTLRQFLKKYGESLVPGVWFAIVSSTGRLKYAQDFLASWFVNGKTDTNLLAKYASTMASDTETEATDVFDEEEGGLKIFNHEIHNATITSDFIDWLENICSPRQRKELLDNLVVIAAIYYDRHKQVDSYEELEESYQNHKGANKVYRKGTGKTARNISEDGECHAWMSFNMGELIVDELLANRKLYPKKTPLNTYFKLITNTLYGVMCSKFFAIANVVVGNNITARARALAYYMEKGLHGFQTITDGCAFELNRVVYPTGERVYADSLVNLYRQADPTKKHIKLAPIGGYQNIDVRWHSDKLVVVADETNIEKPQAWIDDIAMKHLQSLFPSVAVLHQTTTSLSASKGDDGRPVKTYRDRTGMFTFESKDFYNEIRLHGASNYQLSNPNGDNLKFRSYETKKPHDSVGERLEVTERYGCYNNPAKDFIDNLETPTGIRRQVPFVKEAILKVSDYKNRLTTWKELGLSPGDSYNKPGLFREFSLSQFTYQSLEQFNAWEKVVNRLKDKYGQSFEMYFQNPDGTLNYALMISTLDDMVASGTLEPLKALSNNKNSWKTDDHPEHNTYLKLKTYLRTRIEIVD